jgi:rod shape-determining protein MreD
VNRRSLIALGKVALLVAVAVVLQTMLISRVSVLGVTADLFLILTIVLAMGRGSMAGAAFGFVAGVVADVAYMQPLGIRALVYVLTGYFVGMVVLRLGSLGPWVVFLMSIGASFCSQLAFGIFQFVLGPRAGFLTIVGLQILPEAVLDGLIAIPLYVLLVRLGILPEPRKQPVAAKAVSE